MNAALTLQGVQQQLASNIFKASQQITDNCLLKSQVRRKPAVAHKIRTRRIVASIAEHKTIALESAAWFGILGSGNQTKTLNEAIKADRFHQEIRSALPRKFDAKPRALTPRLDQSGRILQLGTGLEISFWRTEQRDLDPGELPPSQGQAPLHILSDKHILVRADADEALAISIESPLMSWALRIAFNQINVFSGRWPFQTTLEQSAQDYVSVGPDRNTRLYGWRDDALTSKSSHHAVRQFVPLDLQGPYSPVVGAIWFSLYGIPPEKRIAENHQHLSELTTALDNNNKVATPSYLQSDHEALGMEIPAQPPWRQDFQTHADTLISLIRKPDIRTLSGMGLENAGQLWQPQHKDPLARYGQNPGWSALAGFGVYLVQPEDFKDWTEIDPD